MKRWYLWATREGQVTPPVLCPLPKNALVSADGKWAERHDKNGVAEVFVQLGEAR